MIYVVLAAGLGANFIVFALLFRRLRQLSWQLRDMRAERNSEWILHALKDVPEQAVQAANGTGFEPPPAGPQPVRRKRHLGLYIGGLGGIIAAVAEATRHAWQTHRGQMVAAGAVLAATTATLLAVIQWEEESGNEPPSSAPTVTATVTLTPSSTPGPTPSASPPRTTGPPANSIGPTDGTGSALPTPAGGASGAPIDSGMPPTPSGTASSEGSSEPSPPGDGSSPPPSATTPPEPPAEPTPSLSSGTPGLCLGLVLWPVLDLTACLAGGG